MKSQCAVRPQVEVIGDGAEIPLVHANTFATGTSWRLNPNFNEFTHATWRHLVEVWEIHKAEGNWTVLVHEVKTSFISTQLQLFSWFAEVPSHVHFICYQLLRNACQATAKRWQGHTPKKSDVTFQYISLVNQSALSHPSAKLLLLWLSTRSQERSNCFAWLRMVFMFRM